MFWKAVTGALPDRMILPLPEDLFVDFKIPENPYDTLSRAGQAADWIFIGDTSHTACATRYHLASRNLLKMMAESGVLHVCLEIPDELDEAIKQFQTGEMTEEEFRRNLASLTPFNSGAVTKEDYVNGIVKTIQTASSLGMSVHAVDPGFWRIEKNLILEYLSAPERQKTWPEDERRAVYNLYKTVEKMEKSTDAFGLSFEGISSKTLNSLKQHIENINSLFNERFNDADLAQNILNATGGEKFAVIYGAGHRDLINRLGGNPLIIDVMEDRAWIRVIYDFWKKEHIERIPDMPLAHVLIDVSKDEAYITGEMPPALKKALEVERTEPDPPSLPRSSQRSGPENGPEDLTAGVAGPVPRPSP